MASKGLTSSHHCFNRYLGAPSYSGPNPEPVTPSPPSKKVKDRTFRAIEFLTAGSTLGSTLGDVGAEHGADSGVCCETPGEFLAIWIPTEVFPQVPAQQGKSSRNPL